MTIRDATPDDLGAIGTIQAASPEAAHWDPVAYLAHYCRVATQGQSITGFLVSRQTGPGEREILNLAVAPVHRRRGIARQLLETELASARGAWFLEVRESNLAARALYAGLGFRPSGRREKYYNGPIEAAIVLRFLS